MITQAVIWIIGYPCLPANALPPLNIYANNIMAESKDFIELFELFNKHQIEYVIVGGYALANLGAPRYTGDIDVLINANKENAIKVLNALEEFGFGSLGITLSDLTKPRQIIQLGYPPSRIDILTSISGVDWPEIYSQSYADEFVGITVRYIGYHQFVKNKKASNRPKDWFDLDALNALESGDIE